VSAERSCDSLRSQRCVNGRHTAARTARSAPSPRRQCTIPADYPRPARLLPLTDGCRGQYRRIRSAPQCHDTSNDTPLFTPSSSKPTAETAAGFPSPAFRKGCWPRRRAPPPPLAAATIVLRKSALKRGPSSHPPPPAHLVAPPRAHQVEVDSRRGGEAKARGDRRQLEHVHVENLLERVRHVRLQIRVIRLRRRLAQVSVGCHEPLQLIRLPKRVSSTGEGQSIGCVWMSRKYRML